MADLISPLVAALNERKKVLGSWVLVGEELGIAWKTARAAAEGREMHLKTLRRIADHFEWGPAEMGQVILLMTPTVRKK